MKQTYEVYNPKPETIAIIRNLNTVISQYTASGYSLTVRQLYYQMIARDLFPDTWIDPETGTKNNQPNYLEQGVYGPDKGLAIITADAFDFKPAKGEKFNVVWHDIWTDINSDMLPDIARLKRKYARRLVGPGKWQGAWLEYEVRIGDRIARKHGL